MTTPNIETASIQYREGIRNNLVIISVANRIIKTITTCPASTPKLNANNGAIIDEDLPSKLFR
jgi:hypothetical protein